MRFVWSWLGVLVLVGAAQADPTPVNLLTSVPTTIAVSSTVDNAKITPEHLVDGDLATAWNSRTGELAGAWIAVRVPTDAKVTSIKLTAGFTHVDKRLGDLFTQNPRIKKVRVTRGGQTLGELTLDITSRALQELKLDVPGGDLTLTVMAFEPGSKKTWREISVSELQVWGTTPAMAKAQRPAVRLGSLDAPPALSKAECGKAVNEVATPEGRVIATEEIGLSPAITLCRVDRSPEKGDVRVTLAAVSRTTRKVIGIPLAMTLNTLRVRDVSHNDAVTTSLYPLTKTETAVIVGEEVSQSDTYSAGSTEKLTLYRVDATLGFVVLISWETTASRTMESRDSDTCELAPITPGRAMPRKLTVDCVKSVDDYHNDDPAQRGTHETARSEIYTWRGTAYVKK